MKLRLILVGMSIILSGLLVFGGFRLHLALSQDHPIIVLFPDTQYMVHSNHPMWESMPQWVARNLTSKNIVAVVGLGDVVDDPSDDTDFLEAMVGWNQIDTLGIPYLPIIGNHDYNNVATRDITRWNSFFPISRFSGKNWYGGSFSGTTENYYIKFTCGGHKYLVLALELFPRTCVLTWAQNVIRANDGYNVIIATHGFLNCDGSRTLHADLYGPDSYGLNADNDAQQMWDNLIKFNAHVIAVVCGHQFNAHTSATRLDPAGFGNLVNQVFINHQAVDSGGGYMGLLTLQPHDGLIDMKTYSAYYDDYDVSGVYTLSCRIEIDPLWWLWIFPIIVWGLSLVFILAWYSLGYAKPGRLY